MEQHLTFERNTNVTESLLWLAKGAPTVHKHHDPEFRAQN